MDGRVKYRVLGRRIRGRAGLLGGVVGVLSLRGSVEREICFTLDGGRKGGEEAAGV